MQAVIQFRSLLGPIFDNSLKFKVTHSKDLIFDGNQIVLYHIKSMIILQNQSFYLITYR